MRVLTFGQRLTDQRKASTQGVAEMPRLFFCPALPPALIPPQLSGIISRLAGDRRARPLGVGVL